MHGQSVAIDYSDRKGKGTGDGTEGRPVWLTKMTFDSCELTEMGWCNGNKLMRNILITAASPDNCINLLH